ncbi:MAG: hypothetical protein QM755_24920 [Luteolibacter sp.]
MKTSIVCAAAIALFLGSCKKEQEVQSLQQSSPRPAKEAPQPDSREVQRLKSRIASLESENSDLEARLTKKTSDYDQLMKASTDLTRSIEKSGLLAEGWRRLSEYETAPSRIEPTPSYSSYTPQYTTREAPAKEAPPAPPAPPKWWVPANPTTAAREAKAAAVQKWPNDYQMAEYEINQQAEAYNELVGINKTANKITKDILARAYESWGTDYSMMLYETKSQLESYQNLQSR